MSPDKKTLLNGLHSQLAAAQTAAEPKPEPKKKKKKKAPAKKRAPRRAAEKKPYYFQTRLAPELVKEVDRFALEHDTSRTEVIRELIHLLIEDQPTRNKIKRSLD